MIKQSIRLWAMLPLLTLVISMQAQALDPLGLEIGKAPGNKVQLDWSVEANAVLEEADVLRSPTAWRVSAESPVVGGGSASVLLEPANKTRFYRLRGQGTGILTRLAETSPAAGETGVAVTRETIFRFTRPLAGSVALDATRLYAESGGRRILARSEISTDRMKVSLFYMEPLPGSSRVRVTLLGSGLTDAAGNALDLDGDGLAGGNAVLEFDTATLTAVAKTAVIGRVFASELIPGPGGQTNSINRPLQGVTVTVDGAEENLRAVTDAQGNFRLEPAPSGTFFVHIDGRTSPESQWPNGAYYPFVGKSWSAVAGKDNNLAGGTGAIYLPLVTAGTLQPVSAQQDTVVTFPAAVLQKNPELAGVQIDVPANALFSDNGARGGKVGIAPVPADRLPGPLPPGLDFPLVITIQTDGPSNFDRPVPVRFPNLPDPVTGEKLAPGASSALWSFNHDTGEWEVVGPMTVSADGLFVVSDPGTGVLQPGWHGSRSGTPGDGEPPNIPDTCGQSGDYAFNESACNARSLKNVSKLVSDAAKLTSSLTTPGAKDALTFLKKVKDTGDDAKKQSDLCHACCILINGGADFGCPGNLFSLSSLSAQAADPNKATARRIVDLANLAGRHAALLQAQLDILGNVTNPELLPADKRNEFNALQGQIQALYGGLSPEAFFDNAMGGIASAIPTLPSGPSIQTDERAFYRIQEAVSGVVLYGKTGTGGAIENIILQPDRIYVIDRYFPRGRWIGSVVFRSARNGFNTTIPGGYLIQDLGVDTDGDGLSDTAEAVIATDPLLADTDGDGLTDGAEVDAGLDPLGGLIAQTGVIASIPLPGPAVDIAAVDNLAVVAEKSAGVSILNIFSGMNPTLIAQVDTPGEARRVSMDGTLVAVADGREGLAVIDISNPAQARVVRQVALESDAEAVVVSAGIVYVGMNSGKIAAVDTSNGQVLETLDAGGAVHDLAIDQGTLFALTQRELVAWSLAPDFLAFRGRAAHNRYFAEGITGRKRLFVGGGFAYATVYPGYDVYDVRGLPTIVRTGVSRDAGPNSFKQIVLNGSGLGIAAVGTNPRNDGTHDVHVYDVMDPTRTGALISILTTPDLARALTIYNGLAYVADSASGVQVINYLPYDTEKQPPTVSLRSAAVNGLVEGGKPLAMTADVTDDVQVRSVEFYVDGARVVTDGNFPFGVSLITPQANPSRTNITLRARATDTGGNSAWSEELKLVLVEDATPPRLKKVSPQEGSIVSTLGGVAVFFSEPIAEATLNGQNLRVVHAGADGLFGTADDATIVPSRIDFRPDVLGAFLQFASPLAPGAYRAEVGVGLKDRAGLALANPGNFGFRIFSISGDRDGDCVPDSLEVALGLNPDNPDSDSNGVMDGDEDFDGDGLSNCGELLLGYDPGTKDSNGNGIPDGMEDFDKDGIADGEEVIRGQDGFITDPFLSDTDGDGMPDSLEIALGLDPTNPADIAGTVVLDGRQISLNGTVRLNTLVLTNGTVLTHPSAGIDGTGGLELLVNNLIVSADSRIDVSGKGYLGGLNGENRGQSGRTAENVDGSVRRVGGSYGGLGGFGSTEPTVAPVYGSYLAPNELGSGGGSDSGAAGNGGGKVRVISTNIVLDGKILANGGSGSYYAGGGSGGAVYLQAKTLSGAGSVEANGGPGGTASGGGGGGRVAVILEQEGGEVALAALGGGGRTTGGPGTIYRKTGSAVAEFVMRGVGRETPLPVLAGNERVTIDGGMVSARQVDAAELNLVGGAVLTHDPATLITETKLVVNAGKVLVDTNSSINVTARGYLGGLSGENRTQVGRTLGNVPGSTRRNGGSYGGLGGIGTTETVLNPIYGDYHSPNEVGSGGGSDSGAAGDGGGLVQINSDTLILEGTIEANGSDGSYYAAGGSGGGIKITSTTVSGKGLIRANGGGGGNESGGGGGGRIAILAGEVSPEMRVQALGGGGREQGASGSVYQKTGTQPGRMIVRGTGRETPLPAMTAGEQLILDGARVSASRVEIAELTLINGAVLTHGQVASNGEPRLELIITRLLIDSNSVIDVSSRGFLGGLSAENGFQAGRTLGYAAGSPRRIAGSYGGLGGTGTISGEANPVYGDHHDPNEHGSGGGSDQGEAGHGGGLVRITAQEVVLQGAIKANGGNGSFYAAAGSGGGVKIVAQILAGAGRIEANGGAGGNQSGGGGGGRVALLLAQPPSGHFTSVEAVTAQGGSGYEHGAPGTVYRKIGTGAGELAFRGIGRETPLPVNTTGERIVLDQARLSVEKVAALELVMVNGAVLTHPGATTNSRPSLEIDAMTVSVDPTSEINVSGRGYLAGLSGMNNIQRGRTYGNVPGSFRRVGGSYGGLGGFGTAETVANPVYGSFMDPNEVGSGGGSDSGIAGNGGGLVRLTADELALDGAILADGESGSFYGGGGSGGGVKITVSRLRGVGWITAEGGRGGNQAGSGGGGRVAVRYSEPTSFDLNRISAMGGSAGNRQGSPGTIYLHGPGSVLGDLAVDAKGTNTPSIPTPLISLKGGKSTALAASSLTDTNADFIPGSLAGLKLKPNAGQTRTFTIVSNDTQTIYIAGAEGSMTEGAAAGNDYATVLAIDKLTIRANASVEVYDGDRSWTDRTGSLQANMLILETNAALTHPVSTVETAFGLGLKVTGLAQIDATSRIDVSEKGYLGATIGGNNAQTGRTLGNVPGSTRRNGGSYGGLGGLGNTESIVNPLYGDFHAPFELGSGGGSDSGPAANGGGRVRLQSGSLILNGRIAANGGEGSFYGGGGSGGAIHVMTGPLSGTGIFQANGGGGRNFSGGGGGGRIALVYSEATGTAAERSEAKGGGGFGAGGAGTIYRKQGNGAGQLTIRGTGRETLLPEGSLNEDVLIDAATVSVRDLTARSLQLVNGAVLTHPAATSTTEPRLKLAVTNLTVDATSRIDVSARGYRGGATPENPGQRGLTLGNVEGSARRNGGSYGGLGGFGTTAGLITPVYGSADDPNELGSGGGSDSGIAGHGGGLVRITAGRVNLEGNIFAHGGNGSFYGGGGSGGGIRIDAQEITGGGRIEANGGGGGNQSGGGGGGRVRLAAGSQSGFTTANIKATGGAGLNAGDAGSIVF